MKFFNLVLATAFVFTFSFTNATAQSPNCDPADCLKICKKICGDKASATTTSVKLVKEEAKKSSCCKLAKKACTKADGLKAATQTSDNSVKVVQVVNSSAKKNCNPADCDPSKCDLTNCDPAKCKIQNCSKAKVKAKASL